MRLAHAISDDQVPEALREMRRHLRPVSEAGYLRQRTGDGVSIAEHADGLLREGFGQ